MAERILVLGGYGVFGGLLARRLVKEAEAEILVAGRSLAKARDHCSRFGGTPLELDRDGDFAGALAVLKPNIVIDAAGPFQAYGQAYGDDPYRVARAAIQNGAHYIDLADDAGFVAGITALDAEAKAAGRCVLSGASSVPAISSAALDELTRGLAFVGVVGSAILPGNRAPRGLSVIRAIVGQAGRPLKQWRGGRWVEQPAWGDLTSFAPAVRGAEPLPPRLASPIGAPDLLLFPERYRARSALFHAGLELRLLHIGLWLMAWLVRLRLIASLVPLATALKWVADRLERFGSDRGGMVVYARGRDTEGVAVERHWTLIAEAGDGPEIPPTPALLICRKLLSDSIAPTPNPFLQGGGKALAHPAPSPLRGGSAERDGEAAESGGRGRGNYGAYPAIGILSLTEIEAGLAQFQIGFGRTEVRAPPLMERVLGADVLGKLPAPIRRLAEVYDVEHFSGMASVERGTGLLSRLVGRLIGFPAATAAIAVEVTKSVTPSGEDWTRRFGQNSFVSHLSHRPDEPGILRERFGPVSFSIRLTVEGDRVLWPVERWRFLGLPMPRALRPCSDTVESLDAQNRFQFHVDISLPVVGFVVRYRGWLEPG